MSRGYVAVSQIYRRAVTRFPFRQTYSCSHGGEGAQQEDMIPSSTNLTKLSHRSLVSISGKDSSGLLQGLMMADVMELSHRQSMYSMLLNAQGRVLYDVILYHQGDGHVLMECDSAVAGDIVKHLKRHALRSEVTIDTDDSCSVWAAYPGAPEHPPENVILSHPDPRVRSFGSRILASIATSGSEIAPSLQTSPPEDYHRHRLKLGVAEGPAEVPTGACFPLEYNIDYLNGVSFSKGCYLGQELTARTHHTGVIRKRVAPVTFEERAGTRIASGTKIFNSSGRNIGKLIYHLGGNGLALLRVQQMIGHLTFEQEGESAGEEVVPVTAHVPTWWPAHDTKFIQSESS